MTDPGAGLAVLHVVVRASDSNSQYNEHCLPVRHARQVTVCSLFPATVVPPQEIGLVEGDGTLLGCFRALREALTARRYDIVHVHAAASALVTLLVYARLRRSRRDLVFTVHNSWHNFRPRNRALLWLVAALFPVVVVCGAAAHASVPRGVRFLARRLEVIPNGVDLERVDAVLRAASSADPSPGPGGSAVLTVGRLIGIKDPETVMEAFVRVASPRDALLVVGDGALAGTLVQGVREAGLEDQVLLTGAVPREDVYRYMRRASVFVSASHGEGLPVAVLEAMACRCPVVLSDIPPHREIARHAPSVQLVDVGDVAGFADAIRRALRRSSFARYLVGDELRRAVERHFSVTAMNHAYGRVYHSVAAQNATRHRGTAPSVRRRPGSVALGLAAVLGALAATWYGGSHAPRYHATTTLAVSPAEPSASDNQVRARTVAAAGLADLTRRQVVLEPVARRLAIGSWKSLPAQVQSRLVQDVPPVIEVTATGTTARAAEGLAVAVADQVAALTSTRTAPAGDPRFVSRELLRLKEDIALTQRQIDARLRVVRAARSDAAAVELTRLRDQLAQLQSTYRSMVDWRATSEASPGLTVIEQARAEAAPWPRSRAVQAGAGAVGGIVLSLVLSLVVFAARREQDPVRGTTGRRLVGSLHALTPEPATGHR